MTLDDQSWQAWWALHRADVLPGIRRRQASHDKGYARQLPAELHAAVDVLLEALDDPAMELRYAAAGVFAGFKCDYRAGETIAALRKVASGHDRWLRDLCTLALGARKDVACIESVRGVLRGGHEKDVSRAFAALALIELGPDAAFEDLVDLTRYLDQPEIAGSVLIGLGAKREPRYLPVLLEAARRRTGPAVRLRRVRCDALTALGHLAHPSTVPFLAGLLADREVAVARSAAIALGGFQGNEDAVRELSGAGLASEDPWVRAFSCISLGRIGLPSGAPALGRQVRNETSDAVRPFALLGFGLLREPGSARVLDPYLHEQPRGGAYGAAALSVGLLGARDVRAPLLAGVADTRTYFVPACGALGLGLIRDQASEASLRARFWLDSARIRPGFDEALALLAPQSTADWLTDGLARARKTSSQGAYVDALSLCGGAREGADLAALYRATPVGDLQMRQRILWSLAVVLRDREVTSAQRLLFHGYYLNPNRVLGHLALLP